MKLLISSFALMRLVGACTPAQSAADQAVAQQSIVLLNDAWKAAATACEASATLKAQCAPVLDKAYLSIIAAASASDAWDSASQSQYGCAVSSASGALVQVFEVLNVAPPAIVSDILDTVKVIGALGGCQVDSGAGQ